MDSRRYHNGDGGAIGDGLQIRTLPEIAFNSHSILWPFRGRMFPPSPDGYEFPEIIAQWHGPLPKVYPSIMLVSLVPLQVPHRSRLKLMPIPKVTDPKALSQFTLYAFLIGLLGALTPEALKDLNGIEEDRAWHSGYWWLGVFVVIVVLLRLYDPAFRRWISLRTEIAPLNVYSILTVRPARGLVLLVSRGAGVAAGWPQLDIIVKRLGTFG